MSRFTYDFVNRLIREEHPDGITIDYVYDALSNRLMKTTTLPGGPSNQPPAAVTNPNPANNATNASTAPVLSWSPAVDPNSGDSVAYFIYFGTSSTPPLAFSGWPTNWSPGKLRGLTTYYWQVVARDSRNAQTAGPLWHFTTSNEPPVADFVSSVTNGAAPLAVTFYDRSISSDDAVAAWQWDFNNDGTVDSTNRNPTYTYTSGGDFSVRLTVTDEHGATGTMVKSNLISVLGTNIVDLSPSGLSIVSAASYGNLLVRYAVTNLGTNLVSAKWQWADQFYVSTNAVLDGAARATSTFYVNQALPPGVVYSRTNLVYIPANPPAGNSFLFLKADGQNQITEISETNNVRSISLGGKLPDLIPGALTTTGAAIAGRTIQAVYSVTNQGLLGISASWYDGFYFSSNAVWDAQDTYTTSAYVSQDLAPGAEYRKTNSVTLPGWPPGNYYLILRADADNSIVESDKANNWVAVPISLGASDLSPVSLLPTRPPVWGQSLPVAYVVTNRGTAAALPYWYDNFYLSQDASWDATDVSIGSDYRSTQVNAGASYADTNTLTLPGEVTGWITVIGGAYLSPITNAAVTGAITWEYWLGIPGQAVSNLTNQVNFPNNPSGSEQLSSFEAYSDIGYEYGARIRGYLHPPATGMYRFWIASDDQSELWLSSDENPTNKVRIALVPERTSQREWTKYPEQKSAAISLVAGRNYYIEALHKEDRDTDHLSVGWRQEPTNYYVILKVDGYDYVYESAETNNQLAQVITVATPDLMPVSLSGPSSAVGGNSVQVIYSVTNRGNGTVYSGWYDRLYLSTNAVWDAQDYQLGAWYQSQSFTNGFSYTRTNTVTLPPWPTGTRYLILKADSDNYVFESEENNNRIAAPIILNLPAQMPDLTPISLTAPATGVGGQQIQVSRAVTNQGNATAMPSWYDAFFLSTNAVWDERAVKIGEQYVGQQVATNGCYAVTNMITLPRVSPGNYSLIVRTDNGGVIYETNETNNERAVTILITASNGLPNLSPISVATTASAVAGGSLTVVYGITNRGTGPTQSGWYDQLYLSRDPVWDAQDYQLGSSYQSQLLTSSSSYTRTNTVTLPEWPGGICYLILRVDDYDYVYESDETDNVSVALPITLTLPDLVPTSVTAPTAGVSGQSIQVVYSVTNRGNGPALPGWYDQLYLSTNATWESTDYPLGYRYQNQAVTNGSSYTVTNTVTLAQWPGGTYYLILKVDDYDYVFESNEFNNRASPVLITLTVPDLAPVSFVAASNIVVFYPPSPQSPTVTVSWAVTNQGTGVASGYWYDRVYVSTNGTISGAVSSQYFYESWSSTPLAVGAVYRRTNTVSLPQQSGTYWLIFQANGYNYLYEANTNNNTTVLPVPITVTYQVQPPDLAPVNFVAASNNVVFYPGSPQSLTVPVTWAVTNQGTGVASGYWYDRVYVSTNTTVSGAISSQSFYEYWSVASPLAVGGVYQRTNTISLPQQSGTYWLVFEADTYNYIYEGNESNNVMVASQPVTVAYQVRPPDLAPVAVAAVSNNVVFYPPGPQSPTVPVTWAVTNQGIGVASGYWYDRVYVSTNGAASGAVSSSTFYESWSSTPLAVGAVYRRTNAVSLPQQSGTYWLVFEADTYNYLYEGNESNNVMVASQPVTVTYQVQPPDLTPVALRAPASVTGSPNPSVTLVCGVTNQGIGAAVGYWYDGVFLSTNAVLDGADTYITDWYKSGTVASGGSYWLTNTVQVPVVRSGVYYLIFKVNNNNYLYESNASNNVVSVPVTFTIMPPDLAAVMIAPTNVTSMEPNPVVGVMWGVTNLGTGVASGGWYDRVWFSTNGLLDGRSVSLGDFHCSQTLPAGGSYWMSNNVTLPIGTNGSFSLFVQVDVNNSLAEINKTNNISAPAWGVFIWNEPLALSVALNATYLAWTSGGNAQWFGQNAVTHDGEAAAKSGAISHSQETWMETTVVGPGPLSFWWKVSSESSYDYLEFYINGVRQTTRISGEVGWQVQNYTLGTGTQVLRWRYMKDGSVNFGQDRAWVDEVSYVPTSGPPLIIAQPANLNVVLGSNVTFTVSAAGSTPLAYQWKFKGTNLVNAGNVSGAVTAALVLTNVLTNASGNYCVVVTNTYGSVTSSVATLNVILPTDVETMFAQMLGSGRMRMTITGKTGRVMDLQGTPDFFHWGVLGRYTNQSGTLVLTSTPSKDRSAYFYRTMAVAATNPPPVAAPNLTGPQLLPDGRMRFQLNSISGSAWRIEGSPELFHWGNYGVLTNPGTTLQITNVPQGKPSSYFYRVAQP